MEEPIVARVAAVIDDSTLVLNAGYRQGVREGMTFVIFGEHAEITDPVTGASLGTWECVKAKVMVTHVQEAMCTVRAPVVRDKDVTDGTRPLSAVMVEHSLGRYGVQPEQWQRLDVRSTDMRGRPRLQPITVGDGARSVPMEEEPREASAARSGGAGSAVGQSAAAAGDDSTTDAAAAPA